MQITSSNKPKRYQVNLPEVMSLYERNYWRLKKMLGQQFYTCQDGDVFDFILPQTGTSATRTLRLLVEEITAYTCTLAFYELGDNRIHNEFLPALSLSPRLSIRLYHDAKMAEVISFTRKRHYQGRYNYPNSEMHQQDEKKQLNTLLAEWLQHCLEHGHNNNPDVLQPVFATRK